jgi:hypothetical protein
MSDSSKGTPSHRAETPFPRQSFFERTDWVSFVLAVSVALCGYLYTLSPEVTLEWSGIHATSAKYGGAGPPPGAPLWTIYAWVFIKVLPISNIAWRLAVSSAVAGALTCGTIALIVSRGSLMLLRRIKRFKRLKPAEELQVRLVCGVVAGLGFGFHGQFWNLALIVRPDALGLLMISIVLCLLTRWAHRTPQTRYLYTAAFIYGLSLAAQISLAALAPTLPLIVLFLKPALGRDILGMIGLGLALAVILFRLEWLPTIIQEAGQFSGLWHTYRNLALLYALITIGLVIKDRRLFTYWRAALITLMLSLSGLSVYFYLPIASMTNPPANWAYARTVEGFYHAISRGQFEHLTPMSVIGEPGRYLESIWHLFGETVRANGWFYLLACIIPWFFLCRMLGRGRGLIIGLGTSFLSHSLLVIIMLNPPLDKGAWSMAILYFLPSHMIIIILAGYGLVLLASVVGHWRPFIPRSP